MKSPRVTMPAVKQPNSFKSQTNVEVRVEQSGNNKNLLILILDEEVNIFTKADARNLAAILLAFSQE